MSFPGQTPHHERSPAELQGFSQGPQPDLGAQPGNGAVHVAAPVNPLLKPSIAQLPRFQTLGNLPVPLKGFLEQALLEEKCPLLPWLPTSTPADYFEQVTQKWVNRHFPDSDLSLCFTDHNDTWYCTTGVMQPEYHDLAGAYLWLEQVEQGFFGRLLRQLHGHLNRVYPIYSPVSAAYYLEATRWDSDYDQFVKWTLDDYCKTQNVSLEDVNMEDFWVMFREQHWTEEDVFEHIPAEFFKHEAMPEAYFERHLDHPDPAVRLLSKAALEIERLEKLLPEEETTGLEDETQAPFAVLYDLDFDHGGDSHTVEMFREEEEMLMNSGEEREYFNCLPLIPQTVDQYLQVAGQMMQWVRTIERTLDTHGNPDCQPEHPAL